MVTSHLYLKGTTKLTVFHGMQKKLFEQNHFRNVTTKSKKKKYSAVTESGSEQAQKVKVKIKFNNSVFPIKK